jgi:DNA-binding MarR family transcriptional regulator
VLVSAIVSEAVIIYVVYRRLRGLINSRLNNDSATLLIPYIENKIKEQNTKLAEIIVKLEMYEAVLSRQNTRDVRSYKNVISIDSQPSQGSLEYNVASSNLNPLRSSSIEAILQALSKRPMSALEVREMLGCTREHAARLMKSMYQRGFVVRDESKRPFVYRLTDKGKSIIQQDRL